MALLYYQNLGVQDPKELIKQVFFGLKTCHDFLQRTKRYMESDDAVKRLAWEPAPGQDDKGDGDRAEKLGIRSRKAADRPSGSGSMSRDSLDENALKRDDDSDQSGEYWIKLKAPADHPNEPESTFQDFLDENVSKIYEASAPSEEVDGDRPKYFWREQQCIKIIDRNPETYQLLLERKPEEIELLLRPNTWPLHCQIKALQTLQGAPNRDHIPLLRLLEPVERAPWPSVPRANIEPDQWMILTDEHRPGTNEQRRFVEMSFATPDFAFLEGPPGSGKTTAICELVLQLASQGKRVLLCASTHVAVDNVLERLMDERNPHRDLVIPIRIGNSQKISEKVFPWRLDQFVKTERERLLSEFREVRTLSASQRALLSILQPGPSAVERLVLDAANLICGTSIGILQHPDIKESYGKPVFDVLIVDEASKTTFQEFLVPALLAKRWIVVGDPRQLSPYVDEDALRTNVASCLPSSEIRDACIDTFRAGYPSWRKQRTTVAAATQTGLTAYRAQAEARGVELATPSGDAAHLATAPLIVGELGDLSARADDMPLDVAFVRAPEGTLSGLRRRADAWNDIQKRCGEEAPSWAGEIGWRLARRYEQRFADPASTGDRQSTADRLDREVKDLLPVEGTSCSKKGSAKEDVWNEIEQVRRVALPSVLESLQRGFERDRRQKKGNALSDGLPQIAFKQRHVLLSIQHRMHSDIAAFSHHRIYKSEALHTPSYLDKERVWGYARYEHRNLWLDVRGSFNCEHNANLREAKVVAEELKHFDLWTRRNPRKDGHPWEVAVLTFYRGQKREIREHLPDRFDAAPYWTLKLCTIDSFQGHEADLVFISVASPHPTSFLESLNRLNVALTRARFQRVVIGHRRGLRGPGKEAAQKNIFAAFAANEPHNIEVQS